MALEIQKVKEAVNKLVDFVKPTYGPAGKKVIIYQDGRVAVLDDGVSIAREFHLNDKEEEAIITLVKEASQKTNDRVGDGTTGSLILLQALLENITEGEDLTPALKEAVAKLRAGKKEISSIEELYEIAHMAYNDEPMAKMISELVFKLGPDAVILLEESKSLQTECEVTEGLQIDSGFVSGYMITDTDTLEAVWEKTPVLVTDRRIKTASELLPIINGLIEKNIGQLVVFADDYFNDAIPTFVSNIIKGSFKVLAIKMPSYGDRKVELMKDICAGTGATILAKESKEEFTEALLGYAEKVVASKETTTIIVTEEHKEDVKKRAEQVRKQAEIEANEFDKDMLLKRAGRLGSGIATIRVGANTSSEMRAVKYKIEDAVNATKVALQSGVVQGGGVALREISTTNETLNRALHAPRGVLLESKAELSVVWDPVEVVIASLESAVSIATLLLTSCGIIIKE